MKGRAQARAFREVCWFGYGKRVKSALSQETFAKTARGAGAVRVAVGWICAATIPGPRSEFPSYRQGVFNRQSVARSYQPCAACRSAPWKPRCHRGVGLQGLRKQRSMAVRCPSMRIHTRQLQLTVTAAPEVASCRLSKRTERKLVLSFAPHRVALDERLARNLRLPLTRSPTV